MTQGTLVPESNDPTGNQLQVGPTLVGFLEEVVPDEAREAVRASALKVLSGALAAGAGSTGLVVGRVQSGKTLSYEGVISLARDNDFAVVIVISGISNPLLAQGESRLTNDLSKADSGGWAFLSLADEQQAPDFVERELMRVRDNWLNSSTPRAYKQTAVVFSLKHYGRLGGLAEVLDRVRLGPLKVLIIDDEADQASLNNLARRGRESTTYANLLALRSSVPSHYYLQYTATPQAPLLIAIQDALSPDFVRVLEPGEGYTGGEVYFGETQTLVRTLGQSDLAAASTPTGPPPESLRKAMQEFLIGAAQVVAVGSGPRTRSMLVHPSRETGSQGVFASWIRQMKANWQDKYDHAEEVPPTNLRTEFHEAWTGLKQTSPELVDFDSCWQALGIVFRNLDITEVNTRAGQTPVINWVAAKSYILVGGQAIDRGFTVEGLTVTYMPRSGGTLTADTIQQRARFFGYKADYLGFCRVYLDPVVREAFRKYVEHERDMLHNLREIEVGLDSLKDWKRRFLLDPSMRATRASVIDIPTIRVRTSNRWVTDRFPVRPDAPALSIAREAVESILADVQWRPDLSGLHQFGWTTMSNALRVLETVSPESLLVEPNFQALGLGLARLADEQPLDLAAVVYRMRPDSEDGYRTADSAGGIQLFAGRTQAGDGYRGDRQVFDDAAKVSIQLHTLGVRLDGSDSTMGPYLISAWRVPETSSTGWIVQVGD